MSGMRVMSIPVLFFQFSWLWRCSGAPTADMLFRGTFEKLSTPNLPEDLPNVTESGYLPLANGSEDALFYAYYTAQKPVKSNYGASGPPIIVWLQVRSVQLHL